ncbi:Vitamin K epoxide reductase [Hymenobacter roseosalivarius DSM 11622]|uniref:Vitamin K epoxide reductase n=1 Tax=Hymenobacter roseosalivarius DSM 11622 TaxID=645990 RepID=A0A1W1US31_9BACT|nr:vitamin K epoxide reductase family protein [Hymenobacter roseosalivarius]SMB83544.1 Vitamin K epoxide reductase [Hymenobacter roseosalivarius DSM 11622]
MKHDHPSPPPATPENPVPQPGSTTGTTAYTCPMHPEVVRDQPGNCPKCGMTLVPEKEQSDQREMVLNHYNTLYWTHATNILLGFFLIASPFTFGYQSPAMTYSDIASGVLLIVFSVLSANPFRLWAPWASSFVGLWLLFAPLVFWSPDASAYLLDSVVGIFAIGFAVLIPEMPGMMQMMLNMPAGPQTPPGWTYNPSSWLQRAPMIVLAWIGFFGARYLTAYQLGYVAHVWDPFFHTGSERVLTSDVSKMFPISDAGLGNVSYALEALMGYMGMSDRWRTMPWMVAFFGILVIPLGVVSIVLITLQPVAVGAWCSVCLLTAVVMVMMLPLTLDEVVAMVQFMNKRVKSGQPFWRTFWMGDTIEGGSDDTRTPRFTDGLTKTAPAMAWGVNLPWTLVGATVVGMWWMFFPGNFGVTGAVANSFTTLGALVITFSVMAMAEVGRALRFVNIAFVLWLVVTVLWLDQVPPQARWNAFGTGAVLVALTLPKGKIRESYGTFDPYIF